MYTSFESLPDHAKVWIYQADRKFSSQEKEQISQALQAFVSNWSSHGRALMASFLLPYDHFVVLAVAEDVAMASGCSIDKSVELIRDIETQTGLTLLNRGLIAYKTNETIQVVPMAAIGKAVNEGNIKPDSLIFNNAVTTLGDFKRQWEIAAADSWMKRYFKSAPTA